MKLRGVAVFCLWSVLSFSGSSEPPENSEVFVRVDFDVALISFDVMKAESEDTTSANQP